MRRLLLSLLLLTGLAACATDPAAREAEAAAIRAADEAECTRLGFTPGTQPFADCMLKLKEIRALEENAEAIDRASRRYTYPYYDPFYGPGPWPRYRYPYW